MALKRGFCSPGRPAAVNPAHLGFAADVLIVLATMHTNVDYLVTLNRKHFNDDLYVVIKSGLRSGTPRDALSLVRDFISTLDL
jgi:hypothetical protein